MRKYLSCLAIAYVMIASSISEELIFFYGMIKLMISIYWHNFYSSVRTWRKCFGTQNINEHKKGCDQYAIVIKYICYAYMIRYIYQICKKLLKAFTQLTHGGVANIFNIFRVRSSHLFKSVPATAYSRTIFRWIFSQLLSAYSAAAPAWLYFEQILSWLHKLYVIRVFMDSNLA